MLLMCLISLIMSPHPPNPIPPIQMEPSFSTNLNVDFDNGGMSEMVRAKLNAEMNRLRDEIMRLRNSMSPHPGSAEPDANGAIHPNMQLVNGMMLFRVA